MADHSARERLTKRLSQYWRLELGSALLIPAVMIFMTHNAGSQLGWLTAACLIPMCGLLAVGGLYWRGKLHALGGDADALNSCLRIADRCDTFLKIASILAVVLALTSWFYPSISASLADRICASVAATLAALEYVNYYRRQLQHFDHWEDFKRLLSGKGFRAAQMAVDLARFRKKG